MAFCENCGTQLSEGAKFCSSCGKATAQAGTPAAATPPKKSTQLKKILFGAAALVVVVGCLGLAAAYYFFHRLSAKAADVTQDLPDVNAIVKELPASGAQPPTNPPASSEPVASLDPNKIVTPEDGQCALFTKEELAQVLGTTFTQVDADATGCTYKGDAPRLWVRTEATWTGGRKLVKAKSDAYKGLRQSMLSQHYSKADIDSHVFPMQPYPGVGDEAWVNLVNVVTARKGNAGIVMDLRYYHDSDDLTKMLTNTALSRLRDKKPDSAVKPDQPVQ
jgi:zinc ribbon protein